MSNIIRRVALVAAILAVPTLGFAQTNGALTRADVRADLVRVEQAGYMPGDGDANTYPADIQAAQARIAAQNGQQSNQSFGGVPMHGTSGSGSAHAQMQSTCVGPVSFCTPFFGS
ncbi:MAG TPA: DUF4148 domain-containing protein [Paraburkholderia sp.]|jgi:hypothetical protein|nr:DUF4148 domain-containing protein [Paraburkholderia sp.]